MIIPFDTLKNYDFALSKINALCLRPSYRLFQNRNRLSNGLIYLTKGKCHYSFAEGEFDLTPGTIVYLPATSTYTMTITGEEIEFHCINFRLHIDGEMVHFANTPTILTESVPPECAYAIQTLTKDYRFDNNTIIKTEKLCTILSILSKPSMNPRRLKLSPAVNYLREHLTERIDCGQLATLCYLSMSQFYNLFHAEYKMTPLEYRNKLLISRAITLLDSEEIAINDVASILGFESAAYFSRFFKKQTGIPPSAYRKNSAAIHI